MRILYVEDDRAMARSVETMLRSEGFNVYTTDLGEEGIELAKLYDYDLLLLDLQLPDISGFEVIRLLRLSKNNTPILVLSGNALVEAKVKALGLGADDYLTKPFHKDELVARIRAVIRRAKGHTQNSIEVGKLRFNFEARTAWVGDTPLHLTGREYHLLELLVLRRGILVSMETALNHLYGGMDEPETRILAVFIMKLRKKFAEALGTEEEYIETVWGQGYILRDPATRKQTGAAAE